ncbi:MAG: hypothetical protein GY714_20955 [Desulfobacterales bacterium]|nr:hypothetical protein [Desulfobacterales bacterium]
MALWSNDFQQYAVLAKITDTNSSSKYYADAPVSDYGANSYTEKLRITGSISNRMPLFWENNFPRSIAKFQILDADNTELSFFQSKYIINAEVVIYYIERHASASALADAIFKGIIPMNAVRISNGIIDVSAIAWIDTFDKLYPLSDIQMTEGSLVKEYITKEKKKCIIPIIYGNFNPDDSGDWDAVKTTEYDGDDSVIEAINYTQIATYSAEKEYESPDIFGSLERQLVGMVDLSGYGYDGLSANTNLRGAVDYKTFDKNLDWENNSIESIDNRKEGSEQPTGDGKTLEVGAMHKVAWKWFEDVEANIEILAIGYKMGWDCAEGETSFRDAGFNVVFLNSDIDRICCTMLDSSGRIGVDGNYYESGGTSWYRVLLDTDQSTPINTSTITQFTCWKKLNIGAFYSREALFFFFAYNDSGGDGHICWASLKKDNTTTIFFVYEELTSNSYDITGCKIQFADATLSAEGARIYFDAAPIPLSTAFAWKGTAGHSTANLPYSLIGCESLCMESKLADYKDNYQTWADQYDNYLTNENSEDRIPYVSYYSANNVYVYYWTVVGSPAIKSTIATGLGVALQMVGLVMYETQGSAWQHYYTFANDRTNDKAYMLTDVYDGLARDQRVIRLRFCDVIYDVCTVTRSKSECYLFVATNEGVFFFEMMSTMYLDDSVFQATTEADSWTDAEINAGFQLYSDVVVNTLTAIKKTQVLWGYDDLKTAPASITGLPTTSRFKHDLIDLYLAGGAFDDQYGKIQYESPDAEDGYIRFSSKYSSLEEIGWFGNMSIGSSEMAYWERLPMWLLWRAEGNTAFPLAGGTNPDCVDWTSWEAQKAIRDNYSTGNIRVYIDQKDRVINHVWRLLRQMGHYMYLAFSESGAAYPLIKLKYMFQKEGVTKTFDKFNCKVISVKRYENYIDLVNINFNRLNDTYFSKVTNEVTTKYSKKNYDFDASIYIKDTDGLISADGANAAWQTIQNFILNSQSNEDSENSTSENPLKIIECLVTPDNKDLELSDIFSFNSTDFPEGEGDSFILFSKELNLKVGYLKLKLLQISEGNYV